MPASAPAASRLLVLPVTARRWVSTDNSVSLDRPVGRVLAQAQLSVRLVLLFVDLTRPSDSTLASFFGLLVWFLLWCFPLRVLVLVDPQWLHDLAR